MDTGSGVQRPRSGSQLSHFWLWDSGPRPSCRCWECLCNNQMRKSLHDALSSQPSPGKLEILTAGLFPPTHRWGN